MLDESPTSVNLKNDYGFIIKKYISNGTRSPREPQSKVMKTYA